MDANSNQHGTQEGAAPLVLNPYESSARKWREAYGDVPGAGHVLRMRRAMLIFLGAFAVVAVRLFILLVDPGQQLSAEDRHHIGHVVLSEPRGDLLDRNGLILATERRVPSLWADPSAVEDAPRAARLLAPRLGMSEAEVLQKLTALDDKDRPRKFVWIKRWLSEADDAALEALALDAGPGVAIRFEPVRYYPHNDTASHVLGFVNRAGDASEGIELHMDDHLRSVPGRYATRVDGKRNLLTSLTLEYVEPSGGDNVTLTLDLNIQHSLERELDRAMEECKAPRAMGLVMDAKTGAILAMACRPSFDPNEYGAYSPELRKNRALVDVFEPGSAFKIVVASAALEHGLVTPETMIDCEGGYFNPYGHRIRDFHKMGVVPFTQCYTESSNIAMIKVAAMLGPERFDAWMRRFGFGETTSRDFRNESRGLLQPREKWSRLSMGALPIGQEIAVTMPQMARAFAAVANGGELVEPYIVEAATSREGEVTYRHLPSAPRRVISPETAAIMRDLCHQVVLHGTGTRASIPEYRVGGKTGTAQMARKDGRGYDPDRFTTVFAGFAPVGDPRIVAVIVVQEPMIRLHYGGYVCGPVFREVVREALIQLHVPEDPVVDPSKPLHADDAEEDTDTVVARLDGAEEGEPAAPVVLEPLDDLELVRLEQDGTELLPRMPDFIGLTKRQARERLVEMGVPWDLRGAGRVVSQHPPAGTPLPEVSVCRLEFANRMPEAAKESMDDKTRSL